MREITGAWLSRDRKKIAVQLDEEIIWITDYGLQLDVTYEANYLPDNQWDELYPETDFS